MEESADAIFFAQDLMHCVLSFNAYKSWDSPSVAARNSKGKTPFKKAIGRCINAMIQDKWTDIADCYVEICDLGVNDRWKFGHLALQAAPRYFSKGYNPGIFLAYCALIYGVSLNFQYSQDGIAEGASDVIALVLMAFISTREFQAKGGWEELEQVASDYNRNTGNRE